MVNLDKCRKEIQDKINSSPEFQMLNSLLIEYLEPTETGEVIRLAVLKSLLHGHPVYLDLPAALRIRVRILFNLLSTVVHSEQI